VKISLGRVKLLKGRIYMRHHGKKSFIV